MKAFVKELLGKRFAAVSLRRHAWSYREIFVKSGLCESITYAHLEELREQGLLGNTGAMILDGSFVEAPKQRNTREENQLIKQGRGGVISLPRSARRMLTPGGRRKTTRFTTATRFTLLPTPPASS